MSVLDTNFSLHFPSWKVILVFYSPYQKFPFQEPLELKMCLPLKIKKIVIQKEQNISKSSILKKKKKKKKKFLLWLWLLLWPTELAQPFFSKFMANHRSSFFIFLFGCFLTSRLIFVLDLLTCKIPLLNVLPSSSFSRRLNPNLKRLTTNL